VAANRSFRLVLRMTVPNIARAFAIPCYQTNKITEGPTAMVSIGQCGGL
jgi:hypothetical protein